MAKIKSIKFYNFVEIPGVVSLSLNVNFYDTLGNLILMDFSNPISLSATYCETSEYIVTASNSYNVSGHYLQNTFHTGNTNFGIGMNVIGYFWTPSVHVSAINEWIKIEFKNGQNVSDIKILHAYCADNGLNTCNYDIEYENYKVDTYQYISNGKLPTFNLYNYLYNGGDQKVIDDMFDSINFNKTISIYDTKIGCVETLDTNNFRNISVNTVERLKVLYVKPPGTLISCLISFDKKQVWKSFNGVSWIEVADDSPQNIILNCMDVEQLNQLDKNKLISGGFTGDLDFKIAVKTNDVNKTSSITKIYLEYK